MRRRFVNVILGFFVSLTLAACSNEPKLDHYGVYAVTKSGNVELKGFQFEGMGDHFQGSKVNDTISVQRLNESGPIQLWVYAPQKTGDYTLLTSLKIANGGEFVCCFNCGSYEQNPARACKTIDVIEKPSKREGYRLFEANAGPGIYSFMNKEKYMGYIFKVN